MIDRDIQVLKGLLERMEHLEITGVSIDSRRIREGELFVALRGERFDGHDFVPDAIRKGAWGALVERSSFEQRFSSLGGLQNILPVEDTLFALQEMSSTHRKKFTFPVVGVTGSNGKTTTKEMLASILLQQGPVLKNEGNLNNHIGVPLTLLKLNRSHCSAVIEMGMSAPGEIDLLARIASPTVGVITNIGPAHLEFFGSMDNIAEAKGELLARLPHDAVAVLNADDPFLDRLQSRFGGRTVTFGVRNRADVSASEVRQDREGSDVTIAAAGSSTGVRLRAAGVHNVSNALAAAATAIALGMPLDAVKRGLEDFTPVSMRSEVKDVEGRTMLADYYNANPASMEAAIETLISLAAGGRSIALLGDMLELGSAADEAHRAVGRIAARSGVDTLITCGTLAKGIAEGALAEGMKKDRVFGAETHAEAAGLLKKLSRPGDVVLIKASRGMKMEKILEDF